MKIHQIEAKIAEISARLQGQSEYLQDIENEHGGDVEAVLLAKIADLEDELDEIETELEYAQSQDDEDEDEIEYLEDQISSIQSELETCQADLADFRETKNAYNSLESTFNILQKQLKTAIDEATANQLKLPLWPFSTSLTAPTLQIGS